MSPTALVSAVVPLVLALAGGAVPAPPPARTVPTAPAPAVTGPASPGCGAVACWPLWPTSVIRGFAPGPYRWSPGHRGVDLAGLGGSAVVAPLPGVLSFAGPVAGRGVAVLVHPGGLRTTYEPVTAEVQVGSAVPAGGRFARLSEAPSHCGLLPCLHWGAVAGETYVDPLGLLDEGRPVVLLPRGDAVSLR